jgi:hypothetical protein
MITTNVSPLTSFMRYLGNTHPALIVVSDNAKIQTSKAQQPEPRRKSTDNASSSSSSRWKSLDYSSFEALSSSEQKNQRHSKHSLTKGIDTPQQRGDHSRWESLNAQSPKCAGLTRPSRNASMENLQSGCQNVINSSSSSSNLPPYMVRTVGEEREGVMYKKMSIKRPAKSLQGRQLTL